MSPDEIRDRIKKSITNVTGIKPENISDAASYTDELAIDSLAILEIVVEVECEFKIKVPEEELATIRTVDETVRAVQKYLYAEVA